MWGWVMIVGVIGAPASVPALNLALTTWLSAVGSLSLYASGEKRKPAVRQSMPRSSLSPMSPIPGEPLDPKPKELTTSDGRKFKVKIPGSTPPPKPGQTEERGSAEPPRKDPRPLINPDHVGP
jgi:hypothetical protein